MKKKYILGILIFVVAIIVAIGTKSYAADDLDEIENYMITVEPRMNDGTLDITYDIRWKVLDSTTEGPLQWVEIGTPNSMFDTPTALTSNIASITKYNDSYVKILFNKKYYAGDTVQFRYKIHQAYMYKISWGKCSYSFTPAWFTDIKVDNLTIKWNMDKVKSSNSKKKEDNYLVWNKTNLAKGEKLTATIKYDKSAFGALNENRQSSSISGSNGSTMMIGIFIFVVFIIIFIISIGGGGGYYGHRGFYGGGYGPRYYGGCVYSRCACAHSSCAHSSCAHSSCACACAGSGRAGCSKKDFYGTKINKDKLKKVLG